MPGKIVKTLEISGVLTGFEIIEGVPDFGESREMIPVTTLTDGDTIRERPHPLKEFKPVPLAAMRRKRINKDPALSLRVYRKMQAEDVFGLGVTVEELADRLLYLQLSGTQDSYLSS
jgi:hypothetical protein